MPKKPKPYSDNAVYLEAELEWVEARCIHLHARRMASNTVRDFPVSAPEQRDTNRLRLFAWQKRKNDTQRTERWLRMQVDERLKQTRSAHRPPALDGLCRSYALSAEERTIVLLAAATSLTRAFEPLFADLSDFEC
ncbi:MAG: hypothetical protein GWP91_06045 [Rhodobacterales bacterium]|nr:hypothetical protein [Rhodobacterales bacterium]